MFRKFLLITLSSFIFLSDLSSEENKVLFKKHFISVDFSGGFSVTALFDYGGFFGADVGYLYAFNEYFAFGPGASGILSIVQYDYYDNDLNLKNDITFIFSGGLILAKFIIGNFSKSYIAFLLDIGVGWIAGINVGILIKNFIIKAGYQAAYSGIAHHINLSFGFMLNFGNSVSQSSN